MNEEIKNIYVYSIWPNLGDICFKEYEGKILKGYKTNSAIMVNVGPALYRCSSTPGVVYNNTIWYFERSPKEAINAFIDFEKRLLQKHKSTFINHEKKLELLNNMLLANDILDKN